MTRCYKCNKLIPEEYQRTCIHCGKTFCPICYGKHFLKEDVVCSECGNVAYCEVEFRKWLSRYNCGNHLIECVICGEDILESEGIFTDDDYFVCQDCYDEYFIECYGCGCEIDLRGDEWERYNDEYYCWDCFTEKFGTCASCGDIFELDEMQYNDDTNEFYCEECYEDLEEDDED